jgi:hypothetical protein
MQRNDSKSVVGVTIGFSRECTGTRVAMPLLAGRYPRAHASGRLPCADCLCGWWERPARSPITRQTGAGHPLYGDSPGVARNVSVWHRGHRSAN